MDHAFINIPEVDNFRPRLVGRFFKWVSRFLHLRPFLMTQVKLIGKGYKRATNSHYRKSSKNDSPLLFPGQSGAGNSYTNGTGSYKIWGHFFPDPNCPPQGLRWWIRTFLIDLPYSGLVAQGPLLAFTAAPQQLNWKCSSQTINVNRKGGNELTSFSPFALFH